MARGQNHLLLAGAAAATLVSCQTITEQAPTQPTKVTLAPIAIPVILPPTPAPTPTPNPTPAPGATPAPTPTPTPASPPPTTSSCNLPPSNPSSPACSDPGPTFLGQVEAALNLLTQQRPDLFDFNDKKCDNCYKVKDVNAYVGALLKRINAQGLCTLWDGEEIAIKQTNEYSEQWDPITSSDYIRRGTGSYRGTCRPAVF